MPEVMRQEAESVFCLSVAKLAVSNTDQKKMFDAGSIAAALRA
jgi:hypothetical protein